jgi:hypothetical protein
MRDCPDVLENLSCWHKLAILEVPGAMPPEEEFSRLKLRNDRTIVLLHWL